MQYPEASAGCTTSLFLDDPNHPRLTVCGKGRKARPFPQTKSFFEFPEKSESELLTWCGLRAKRESLERGNDFGLNPVVPPSPITFMDIKTKDSQNGYFIRDTF